MCFMHIKVLTLCYCILCLTSTFKAQADITVDKSWHSLASPYNTCSIFLSIRHNASLNSLHAGIPPTSLIFFDNPLIVCEELQNETRQPRSFSLHLVNHLPNPFYTLHPTFMSSNGIAVWRQGVLILFGHFHLSGYAKKASRHVL